MFSPPFVCLQQKGRSVFNKFKAIQFDQTRGERSERGSCSLCVWGEGGGEERGEIDSPTICMTFHPDNGPPMRHTLLVQ